MKVNVLLMKFWVRPEYKGGMSARMVAKGCHGSAAVPFEHIPCAALTYAQYEYRPKEYVCRSPACRCSGAVGLVVYNPETGSPMAV